MNFRATVMGGVARQLGHPSGMRGRLIGAALNRGNRRFVQDAAQALEARAGAVVADVGFGGGIGLKFLLADVGESGQVHGVEVSETMLSSAARRYRRQLATGRLLLHSASASQLPFGDGALQGVLTVNTVYFIADLDLAAVELARVIEGSGRIVIGLGDPEVMEKMPFTRTGFRLRPVPEVIDTLRGVGLTVEHRRISDSANAPHLLIATRPPFCG
jgi:arsenite methyltransferase